MEIEQNLMQKIISEMPYLLVSGLIMFFISKITSITPYFRNKFNKPIPKQYLFIALYFLLAAIVALFFIQIGFGEYISIILFLFFIILLVYLINFFLDLKSIGIFGFDKQIKDGINYKQSLSMVESDFMFLGVGAHKLTNNLCEFESALLKSDHSTKKAKLLLCHPDSEALKIIAKKADNFNIEQYSIAVKESLTKINALRNKGIDFSIRFYKADTLEDMPIFRLMFFDSKYCLASYSVFGLKGSTGETLPQLYLIKNNEGNSFYFAFSKIFEKLWSSSNEFNLDDL
ncbi:MAG: hypothetical protein FE834_06865 [Gammaproteobacteria bacterium]|nr:hypothetical protein [Gammaproteobacteria bacterium]